MSMPLRHVLKVIFRTARMEGKAVDLVAAAGGKTATFLLPYGSDAPIRCYGGIYEDGW